MEKINLTKVSKETRETIKRQVIKLLKKKIEHQEIAEVILKHMTIKIADF